MTHKFQFEKFAKEDGFERFIVKDDGIAVMLQKIAKAVSYTSTKQF